MVVGLIGLLAAIVVTALNETRAKTRDTRRIRDFKNLITALELYRNEKDSLPVVTEDDGGGWDVGNPGLPANNTFIKPLTDEGILRTVIVDVDSRFNDNSWSYRYRKYIAGESGNACDYTFAVLGVKLEKSRENYNLSNQVEDCYKVSMDQSWVNGSDYIVEILKE